MLSFSLPETRLFNEITEEFLVYKPITVRLEHSLISISKWESKWHKSYLSAASFTKAEFVDYIRCMQIDSSVEIPALEQRITAKDIATITAYIKNPMTATTFSKMNSGNTKKIIITSELVYYWMVSYGIPFECEKWHVNRLLTLIEICGIKQSGPQKTNKMEAARLRAAANSARRKRLGTKG